MATHEPVPKIPLSATDLMEVSALDKEFWDDSIRSLGIIYFMQTDLAIGLIAKLQPCFKYIIPNPLFY
jgi:hypothetical protein